MTVDGYETIEKWRDANKQRDVFQLVLEEMLLLNEHLTKEQLTKAIQWDGDNIEGWSLYKLGLKQLPEVFGGLRVAGDLNLACNQLATLPASFGSLEVGGSLLLYHNKLISLPESFGQASPNSNPAFRL